MGPQFEVSGAYGPRLPKIVRAFCRLFALMFAIGVWPPPVFGDGGSGSGAVLPAPLTSPILNESAPPPSESGRIPESKGEIPSKPPIPRFHRHKSDKSLLRFSESQSKNLTDYLHTHKLPFINGQVYVNRADEPRSVTLSGKVRTDMGRTHAEERSEDFLGNPRLRFKNEIEIDPNVGFALTPAAGP